MHSMQQSGASIGYGGLSSSMWSNAARRPYWYEQKWKHSTTDYRKVFPLLISEAINMDDVIYVEILTSLGAVPEQPQIHHAAFNGQDELLKILCTAFVSTNVIGRRDNLLYLRELRDDLQAHHLTVQVGIIKQFCETPSSYDSREGMQVVGSEDERLQQARDDRWSDKIVVEDQSRERRGEEERGTAQRYNERDERERAQEEHVRWRGRIMAEDERRERFGREQSKRAQDNWDRDEGARQQEERRTYGGRENIPRFLDIRESTVVINKDVFIFVSVCSCGFLFLIFNGLVLALSISFGFLPSLRALPLSKDDEGWCRRG